MQQRQKQLTELWYIFIRHVPAIRGVNAVSWVLVCRWHCCCSVLMFFVWQKILHINWVPLMDLAGKQWCVTVPVPAAISQTHTLTRTHIWDVWVTGPCQIITPSVEMTGLVEAKKRREWMRWEGEEMKWDKMRSNVAWWDEKQDYLRQDKTINERRLREKECKKKKEKMRHGRMRL